MNMKFWLFTFAFLIPLATQAVEFPPMVCREQQVIQIDPSTLETHSYISSSLYRFTREGLFLSDKDRQEYFYNEVKYVGRELSKHRFASAHKTFIFDNAFKRASAIHINGIEVRVSQLLCTRTEPDIQ